MAVGVIYILTNPSFPDYIKIGYANNIENRLRELNHSETIPFAFRVYAIYEVDKRLTDKELHRLIDILNPDLRTIETFDGKERTKEFYAMSAEDAYLLLECIAKISGTQNRLKRMTPEGHEVLDEQMAEEIRENNRRGPLKFSECGINIGEKIQMIPYPEIEATVIDDRKVKFEGETLSMTALADKIFLRNNKSRPNQAATLMFSYKGTCLVDLRK